MRRNPSFSAIAIGTLALGIGGVAAVFGAVDAVLIRPLPYAGEERLVTLWDDLSMSRTSEPKIISTPFEWIQWRRLNSVFTDLALTQPGQATLPARASPSSFRRARPHGISAVFWESTRCSGGRSTKTKTPTVCASP